MLKVPASCSREQSKLIQGKGQHPAAPTMGLRGFGCHATFPMITAALCLRPAGLPGEVCVFPGLQLGQASDKQIHTSMAAWLGDQGVVLLSSCNPAPFFTLATGGLRFPCLDGSLGLSTILQQD